MLPYDVENLHHYTHYLPNGQLNLSTCLVTVTCRDFVFDSIYIFMQEVCEGFITKKKKKTRDPPSLMIASGIPNFANIFSFVSLSTTLW